jgi:hypothetical protein
MVVGITFIGTQDYAKMVEAYQRIPEALTTTMSVVDEMPS